MTTDNLERTNRAFQLKRIRYDGAALLKGRERTDFLSIKDKYDTLRTTADRLYAREYRTRVDIAYRDLLKNAGAKKPEIKPSFFGLDRFNTHDLTRQAERNVRLDHMQTMDRLDAQEMKESRAFLEKSSERKTYLENFKRSAERRRSQSRRQSPDRRRSPVMSD